MSQTKDFRGQSAAPTTPADTDKFVYYTNTSGILHFKNSVGNSFVASTFYPQTLTGATTGTNSLGLVQAWIPVVGPSGQQWAIPVWNR